MCIRDRDEGVQGRVAHVVDTQSVRVALLRRDDAEAVLDRCLLYTSDAADERSSVDLGGRRIIKKKNTRHLQWWSSDEKGR